MNSNALFAVEPLADRQDRPTSETVQALEFYGHKPENVRRWTRSKAESKLSECRKIEAIDKARAEGKARSQDDPDDLPPDETRGRAPQPTCEHHARWIEEAIATGNPIEIMYAATAAIYCLADARTKKLASHLILVLRGQV